MKSFDLKHPNQDWHPNIWPPFTQINTSKPQIEVTHGKDTLLFTKDPKNRTFHSGFTKDPKSGRKLNLLPFLATGL